MLTGGLIRILSNKAPQSEVMEAGKMLAEAQRERSPGYAASAFQEAVTYYDSAMVEWNRQNDRMILLRDYRTVSGFAQKSMKSSEEAIRIARRTISNTEDALGIRLEQSGDKIRNFDKNFGRFPMDKEHRERFARCKLLYSESLQAYKNKNYTLCVSRLDSVEAVMNDMSALYRAKLEKYFEDYPKWEVMVEQSIAYSKKHQTHVLVVDKMARELVIYKNGRVLKQYPVELGANWVGDKMQQGDKSTPEGLYRILDKKQNGQTRYYKAFLLDYPNVEDKKRFSLNKKNGVIHPDARIGNLIEIHGSGGRGIDWTDGCIALRDSDMNELYALCPVDTRITIVGSTKSFNSLLSN
jgi:hypothetical protein